MPRPVLQRKRAGQAGRAGPDQPIRASPAGRPHTPPADRMYATDVVRRRTSRGHNNRAFVYWAFTRYDRRTDQSDRPVGPTGLSDWSVRRSYRVNASFDRSDRRSEESNMFDFVRTVEACGHYVRLVGPTGQSDDQSRCSVGGTCCLRHSYIVAAVIYTSGG